GRPSPAAEAIGQLPGRVAGKGGLRENAGKRHPLEKWRGFKRSISPPREMDAIVPSGSASRSDSGLSARTEKSSTFRLPSQDAPYTIVCPSGAKRADQTGPRRNVSTR